MTKSIHIVPTIDNEASGPSYSIPRLCDALNNTGYDTQLAVLEPAPEVFKQNQIKAFPYGIGPKRLGFSPGMKKWLQEMAQTNSIQILHNHSLWMMPNFYPAHAVNGTDCKLVLSPRGTLSKVALARSPMTKFLMRPFLVEPVLKHAAAFHATSRQEYEDIRRQGCCQPVAVIPNGIDIPDMRLKEKKNERELLFLGRFHPIKGIANLLHAWKQIQSNHKDWKLSLVGPDNNGHLQEMKHLANQLNLERCNFLGAYYGDDKMKVYQDADLYVLPTHSENFGMTVAETLAAGTPAIVTKGAPWEGLKTQHAGWWIDVGIEPLVETLNQALKASPEALNEMGTNGRNWMTKEFSWEKIASDMLRYYEWLATRATAPDFVYLD